jgi:microcystin-dependent protein
LEGTIGEIRIFAGNFAPVNWFLCDGTTLNVSDYVELFSVISNTYGGDGRMTFFLPNLTFPGRSGEFGNYIICYKGLYPRRA